MDAPFDTALRGPQDTTQDRLRQTYRFIESYHHRVGIMPTQREIGAAFGITPTGAFGRVKRMVELGWIAKDGRYQSIVLKGMR